MTNAFSINKSADGIATITWDDPDQSTNLLTADAVDAFHVAVSSLMADDGVTGILIESGKSLFSAGHDVDRLIDAYNVFSDSNAEGAERYEPLLDQCRPLQSALRTLETGGKPVAVAIEGSALGGGFEVCLAAHRRYVGDNSETKLGFPDVTLGLVPGGGGTQRAIRLAGIKAALPLLLEGRPVNVTKAAEIGLVDEVVQPGEAASAARAWLKATPAATQAGDEKKFKVPGGDAHAPGVSMLFDLTNPLLCSGQSKNSPGKAGVVAAVYEGSMATMDQGLASEAQYFAKTLADPRSRNFMRTGVTFKDELRKLARRPSGAPDWQPRKVGVVGVGMMGAGIAYTCARSGLDVVMIDQDQAQAEKGIAYAEKAMARAKIDDATQAEILGRLHPTTDLAALDGADLAIEAVFESVELKRDILKKMEDALSGDYCLASNTTSLLISELAEALDAPERFLGMHFFSPVDRMELLEIISGEGTDDNCLAHAMDAAKAIGKTPITVRDSRGFYTSRVVTSYEFEGLRMLTEGVAPALIENGGKLGGMPFGPLNLLDLTALDLNLLIRREAKAALGSAFQEHPGDAVLEAMVETHDRMGRKTSAGFYDYHPDRTKTLWRGLSENWAVASEQPPIQDVIDRLLYAQSIETLHCMAEGVVTDPREADVGAVLGWSYPLTWGGPVSFIDTVGAAAFLQRANDLASTYGNHLAPPDVIADRLRSKGRVYV